MTTKFQFKKIELGSFDRDEDLEVPIVKVPSDFVIDASVRSVLDEADDVALFLIANGVNAKELATFVKVSALLGKANFSKEVTPPLMKSWNRTMHEFVDGEIPPEIAQKEYDERTTIRKTVVTAFAALLHINKKPQAYLSVDPVQQDRGDMEDGFLDAFKTYSKSDVSDAKMSKDFLGKVVKTGCDNYNIAGGIQIVADLPLDDRKVVDRILRVGEAAQRDKSILSSKLADPFNFVCNGIDSAKSQSYEHAAMRASSKLFPNSLLYCVDDKVSIRDLDNTQMNGVTEDYAPYLKFKATGSVGDVLTNRQAYECVGLPVHNLYDSIGFDEDERHSYDANLLEFADLSGLIELLSSSSFVNPGEGFTFGKCSAEYFIPARFNRLASVEDLSVYHSSIQLMSLSVMAGALKKSQYIFETHTFLLFDPLAHLCFAIPAGYKVEMPTILSRAARDPAYAGSIGVLPITSNNVKFYLAACSELNSYALPIAYNFYNNLLAPRDVLFATLNTVLASVQSINGNAYGRVTNLLFGTLLDRYVFLVGSEKIDDKRVSSFVNEALIDKVSSPTVKRKDDNGKGRAGIVTKRNFSFRRDADAPPEDSGIVTTGSSSYQSPPPENETDEQRAMRLAAENGFS